MGAIWYAEHQFGLQIEILHQALADTGRRILIDLQAHHVSLAAVVHHRFHGLEQIAGVLVHVEVAVARHPEAGAAADAVAAEKIVQEQLYDVVEEHVAVALALGRQGEDARQGARDGDHPQAAARDGAFLFQPDAQA
jgi:hypothetical protein